MNKTILKIAGIVAIALGSVALFITGIGESAVIAIVSAVFVLAGLIAALFGFKKPGGAKAVESGAAYIELVSLNTRTRKIEIVGTVDAAGFERVKKSI
jgi:hypothetical protein